MIRGLIRFSLVVNIFINVNRFATQSGAKEGFRRSGERPRDIPVADVSDQFSAPLFRRARKGNDGRTPEEPMPHLGAVTAQTRFP